jgi:hypothetical protein
VEDAERAGDRERIAALVVEVLGVLLADDAVVTG